jgi:hypothetical protein
MTTAITPATTTHLALFKLETRSPPPADTLIDEAGFDGDAWGRVTGGTTGVDSVLSEAVLVSTSRIGVEVAPPGDGESTADDTLRPQFLQNLAPGLSSTPHPSQWFGPSPTAIGISSSAANPGSGCPDPDGRILGNPGLPRRVDRERAPGKLGSVPYAMDDRPH